MLQSANNYINKLSCECDTYGGYECILCDWKRRITKLREEVDIAIEHED